MTVSARRVWLLVAVLAAVWFANLEFRKLVRPDEGRYAELSRSMFASGDWVTPRLNDLKYFYKPALQYWATATAYTLFGEHHWTARLWSALTGFLGVLATGWIGARLWGRPTGVAAGAILAGALLYCLIGHVNTLDMGVTFFLCAGLYAFVLAQRAVPASRAERGWMLAAWAALALAVLSKGLIGAALPFATLIVYSVVARDASPWRRLHPLPGGALFLAITAPWFVWVTWRNPEFFHFFFIHEHFERFLTKVHARVEPAWYFVPLLLGGILPWTWLLPGALWRAARAPESPGFRPRLFLLVWCGFVFAFFSVSSSKLPSYILPIFPPLALLIADHALALPARRLARLTLPWVFLGLLALAAAPQATRLAKDEVPLALYAAYVPWLMAAAAAFAALAALAWRMAGRGRPLAAIVALAAGGVAAAQLGLTGHDALSPATSAYHIAPRIIPHLAPGVPFYSVGMYEQTLPFYIKRSVTLVTIRDEMDFGLTQEPRKWVADEAEFARRWRAHPAALAIMHPNKQAMLDREKLPYEIIARDTRRLVVKKPAPP